MMSEEIKDKINDYLECKKNLCGHKGFYALQNELADVEYTVEVTDAFYKLTLTRKKRRLRVVQHISNLELNQARNPDAALNTVIEDTFNMLFGEVANWNEVYLS